MIIIMKIIMCVMILNNNNINDINVLLLIYY